MKINYQSKLEALTRYILTLSDLRQDSITNADAITLSLIILLPSTHKYNPLSRSSRQTLCKILNISQPNLNNRLYSLQRNKYLYRDEDNLLQITKHFKNLKNSTIDLNVSYTYDSPDIPSDIKAITDSLYTRGSNTQIGTPPLQESQIQSE